MLKLILRSVDIGEGWRRVSPYLAPLVTGAAQKWPDLIEMQERDGGIVVRLTAAGIAVATYC